MKLLATLFTGAAPPVTSINVMTLSDSEMDDFAGSAVTAGSTVSARGLLFNTPTTPMLLTRTIRDDNHQ